MGPTGADENRGASMSLKLDTKAAVCAGKVSSCPIPTGLSGLPSQSASPPPCSGARVACKFLVIQGVL